MGKKAALCLLLALLLCGCTADAGSEVTQEEKTLPAAAQPPTQEGDDPVETLLAQMTLRQRVGQLFLVRPDALDPTQTREQINDIHASGVTAVTDGMRQMLAQYPVGGVCLFGKNLASPAQLTAFNADLQSASALPLFLAVDEEGGAVSRLANHPAFDLPQYRSAAAVADEGPDAAREMGHTIGAYLRGYGFNLDFAPVADVNTNPDNPVIGTRAFSSDAQTAAEMAAAMARGLYEEQVLPTFKHFPGHGDTAEDSHTGQAVTWRTREEMEACELLPFLAAKDSVPLYAVMVGHITAPNLFGAQGDGLPASLSPQAIGLLRQLLPGCLVITDSLAMRAVTDLAPPGEAAVMALQAGCDLLLMPDDLAEAYEAVLEAVADGTLTEACINDSVRRILAYKAKLSVLSLQDG